MPAHDPKSLPRVTIRYHTAYGSHKCTFHVAPTTDPSVANGYATTVSTAMKPLLSSSTAGIDGADFILAGTNVANPLALGVSAGTWSGAENIQSAATSITFVGRTPLGTRARFVLFSGIFIPDTNFRYTGAEITAVGTFIAFLNGNTNPIVGADGAGIVWKNYGNVNVNKHWTKVRRRL